MIDVTCCFANNLEKDTALKIQSHEKNIIAEEFETAVSEGYTRFLAALKDYADIDIVETLIEARNNLDNANLIIEAVVAKNIFFEESEINKSNNIDSELTDSIKNCMVKCNGIIEYHEDYRGLKFHNINHYLLNFSTKVILLYSEHDKNDGKNENEEKVIDDFFISHMLQKDVKKVILN